jgi:hypothetical protein
MEIFGPIRSSRASVSECDLAVPIDEVLSVSLCLRESQEPSANKSLHASGRQRWFPSRSQTRPPRELASFALREMISRRHRGTEKNATVSATLVVYVRCEEAKVRWRFSGLFDRRGQACLNAIWLFQSMKFSPCLCVSVRAKSRARTSRCMRAGGSAGFQVEVKPARRVNLVVRSQGNDLTETQRHGEERNCQRDAWLSPFGCEEAKVRWRFSGLFDRRGQACLNAIWLFQSMKFSPCLRVSVRAKSASREQVVAPAEPAARRFQSRSQTRPPCEPGRSFALREMISRRHRGTEKNATVSAMLVVSVRCEEAKVRWRFSGLFDRRGQACLNAIWLFQSMNFSPCLCVSVRAKSASANKSLHASGRQRAGFEVEVKPARRVNLPFGSLSGEMISRRHRGTEKNATVSAMLVVSVRFEEAKVRWRIFGPIRSSRASVSQCDLAVPID